MSSGHQTALCRGRLLRSSIAPDEETSACLDTLSERVDVVEDRFILLQGFSRAERAAANTERLELRAFLRGFYESNRPDIELSLRQEDGCAVISASDTGSGIAPEALPHVFERGFTRRPDNSGEGLGLYIVRSLALEHGSSAEAGSAPGIGSTFTLRLPLARNLRKPSA